MAARIQYGEDHQVGIREQPFFSLLTGRFRGAGEEAEVFAARGAVQVFQANAGQPGNLIGGKELLT